MTEGDSSCIQCGAAYIYTLSVMNLLLLQPAYTPERGKTKKYIKIACREKPMKKEKRRFNRVLKASIYEY